MSGRKIAVVTGSNKGIGFAIVRGLCKQWEGDVFLTARDAGRGHQAVEDLKKEGLNPKFHQLDITDGASVEKLRQFIQDNYGGLDILVNNAAIAYKMASTAPFYEQAEVSCDVNFIATLNTSRALFPLLRSHARVVNVSSLGSFMAFGKCSEEVKSTILKCSKMEDVQKILDDFVASTKAGTYKEKGYPESAYGMSKVGVTAMSIIQQKEIDQDKSREDIIINACCPGYVATDMSSFKGTKTIDEGAVTPLHCALLPPNIASPRGKFLSEKEVKEWN